MKRIAFLILILLAASQAFAFPPTPPCSSATMASTSAAGIVELATDVETLTGSATDKVTTPANLTAKLAAPGPIGGTTPGAGSFSGVTVTGLTASKPVFTDGSKGLSSSGTMPIAQGGTGLTALGTAGQVLRVNSGADALEYGTVSSTVPIGHLSGLVVSRKDNDEIYVSGGSIEMGGVLYNSGSQLAVAPGGEPTGYGSDLFAWTSEYATASDSYLNDDPWNALDDSDSSRWMPANTSGTKWWQYQFSEAKRLEKVTIQAHSTYNNAPTDWTLQASNTGAFEGEQVTLLTVADDDTWTTSEKKEFTFTNANSYTYYRFVITDWKKGGAGGDYLSVGEFEGYEASYVLAASTPYYVYVDPPGSGAELAVGNFILSPTAPSFGSAKGGFYHPTNTDQRAIAHFTTDASGYVPTAPFVHYQPLPAVSSGAQLLSITNLPLNADGETTIYTVPAGVRCVLSYAILVAGADAASTDLTIGADGAETDWLGTQQLDNLDAENDAVMLMPVPNSTPVKIKSYAATTVIKAVVANQAGGATNTLYLYGMLY